VVLCFLYSLPVLDLRLQGDYLLLGLFHLHVRGTNAIDIGLLSCAGLKAAAPESQLSQILFHDFVAEKFVSRLVVGFLEGATQVASSHEEVHANILGAAFIIEIWGVVGLEAGCFNLFGDVKADVRSLVVELLQKSLHFILSLAIEEVTELLDADHKVRQDDGVGHNRGWVEVHVGRQVMAVVLSICHSLLSSLSEGCKLEECESS